MKLVIVIALSFAVMGCGNSRCSNDHDEFYRYWTEGIDVEELVKLFVGRSELSQSCNEIGYFTGSAAQRADLYHIEPRLELQNRKLGAFEAEAIDWRVRAIHGGLIYEESRELFPTNERVISNIPQLFVEDHDLGRNIRIEASVQLRDPETGEVAWAHATGAAHLDTSR